MLDRLYMDLYLRGLHGWIMPRSLRRLIAGTACHRAWLMGHLGYFEQDGIAFGPANRYQDWLRDLDAELVGLLFEDEEAPSHD